MSVDGGLTRREKRLLTLLQRGLPLTRRPYAELGGACGLDESEVLAGVAELKARGIIRRLGGIFDTRALGFHSTLVAMKVPPDRLERVAETVNAFPGVTHNYAREGEYNLWFTLIAPSAGELGAALDGLVSAAGSPEFMNLPTVRLFKIGAKFELE